MGGDVLSWDPVWEQVFRSGKWGKYPPEELIRFVAAGYYDAPDRSAVRILEIGCGPGANVWYLAREGFDAHGIDGSETAVRLAAEHLESEGLKATLTVGDFSQLADRYEPSTFDAVVDVAALQHNRAEAVARTVEQIRTVLKPGGRAFAMLVASGSWGDGLGRELEPGTYAEIEDGPLVGMGVCRFFPLEEVEAVFAPFDDVRIEESHRTFENRRRTYAHWVVTATRRR